MDSLGDYITEQQFGSLHEEFVSQKSCPPLNSSKPSGASYASSKPGIRPARFTAQIEKPVANALNKVPTTAYVKIVPMLLKNASFRRFSFE